MQSVHDVCNLGVKLSEAVICLQALLMEHMWGGSTPLTFDLCHALTLAHPNSSMLVNELEDLGAIEGSVRLESACERFVIVWRWCHPGSGLCNCV